MLKDRRIHLLQVLVGILWLAVFIIGVKWMLTSGIPFRHAPRILRELVRSFGVWGPIFLLSLYVFRSIFFLVPITVLTLVCGSLYGPVWGTILNIIGENLTANISFGLGRLFGRRFVREHEHGWVKKYDELLRHEGFLTILFMRALYFPFDLVNFGSGVTGIVYRQYVIGTFIGLLPVIVTLTVLGDAFTNPRAFVAFAMLFVVTLAAAFLLRRSAWIKRRLYPPHVHEHI